MDKVWGINGISLIFSSEENAKVVCDFMNIKLFHKPDANLIDERWVDVGVSKIKRGFKVWKCLMYKDGVVAGVEVIDPPPIPTKYGFYGRRFYPDNALNLNHVPKKKMIMIYQNLAENEVDIIRQAEKQRIKTIMDDCWNKYADFQT